MTCLLVVVLARVFSNANQSVAVKSNPGEKERKTVEKDLGVPLTSLAHFFNFVKAKAPPTAASRRSLKGNPPLLLFLDAPPAALASGLESLLLLPGDDFAQLVSPSFGDAVSSSLALSAIVKLSFT